MTGVDVGLATAFLGGALALLSPCSALLLPAFFASTVGTGARLLAHGAVFYAGLLIVLLPLGAGAGAAGALLVGHRQTVIAVASLLLVALGLLQAAGLGFDPSRLLPGSSRVAERAVRSSGYLKTLLLGATGGVAGFCAGPILGGVLTLAAARGSALAASGLLAVYGAGMLLPLLGLALGMRRLGARGRRFLAGRAFTVFGLRLHTTSLVTGLLLVAVGVLFWTTNGLVSAPELVPTAAQSWLQERASALSDPIAQVVLVLVAAATALTVWALRRRRHAR